MTLRSTLTSIVSALVLSACTTPLLTSNEASNDSQPETVEKLVARYYLPTGAVHISGHYDADLGDWNLEYEPKVVAAADKAYYLYRASHYFFDDKLSVETDETTGLLKLVDTTTDDKTGQILKDTVETAKAGLIFGVGITPTTMPKPAIPKFTTSAIVPDSCTKYYSYAKAAVSGPLDIVIAAGVSPQEIHLTNNEAAGRLASSHLGDPVTSSAAKITLTLTPQNPELDVPVPEEPSHDNGVAVKWPVPYTLEVKSAVSVRIVSTDSTETTDESEDTTNSKVNKAPGPPGVEASETRSTKIVRSRAARAVSEECYDYPEKTLTVRQVMLPSTGFTYFPVLRRSFVADKTVLTIKNGMLTTVNVERPSSVAGAVGIPKAVLQALAPIPLELRQNTTNNVNAIFDMKEAKEKLRSRD
ncbi:MAG: hypothetical protein IPG43_01880 [Proteobacteria bacterium]|nr:hypothetical protein [Pseudomonadota bacterium]